MRLTFIFAGFVLVLVQRAGAGEETIRGMLEKTSRPGACAQIADALAEVYYINKTDAAEKLIADYVGKNVRVVITGSVEQKENDPAYYFALKSVEKHTPKLPVASPQPADKKAADPRPAETPKADPKPAEQEAKEKTAAEPAKK